VGTGAGGGIGSGSGRGLGPGSTAGTGGGVFRVGGGVSAPVVIYKPEPEYSEEARKVKHQGVVLMAVIVGPDGRPRDLRILRPLGMGLDEKALEAVRTWRFEPAKKDGVPVAVLVNIEVGFNLY
jgi:TonB family protein